MRVEIYFVCFFFFREKNFNFILNVGENFYKFLGVLRFDRFYGIVKGRKCRKWNENLFIMLKKKKFEKKKIFFWFVLNGKKNVGMKWKMSLV